MKSAIINGKEIVERPVNFKTLVDFEKMGFNIAKMGEAPFSAMATILAYDANYSFEKACNELNEHIENGGSFDDVLPLLEAINDSPFFQRVAERQQLGASEH